MASGGSGAKAPVVEVAGAGAGLEGLMGRGRVGQGALEGGEEARRRFEVLAAGGSVGGGGELLGRLPKDDVAMRRAGLVGGEGARRPPSSASLKEKLSLPSNERLGKPGHVAIASASKEAYETRFTPDAAALMEDAASRVAVETRELGGGGRLRLLRGPDLRAALLTLPNKVLYAERTSVSALLISSHQPSPDTLPITHRLQSI